MAELIGSGKIRSNQDLEVDLIVKAADGSAAALQAGTFKAAPVAPADGSPSVFGDAVIEQDGVVGTDGLAHYVFRCPMVASTFPVTQQIEVSGDGDPDTAIEADVSGLIEVTVAQEVATGFFAVSISGVAKQ